MRSSALGVGLALNRSMNNSCVVTNGKAENGCNAGVSVEVGPTSPSDWFHVFLVVDKVIGYK